MKMVHGVGAKTVEVAIFIIVYLLEGTYDLQIA
jgi:hypothetical protein